MCDCWCTIYMTSLYVLRIQDSKAPHRHSVDNMIKALQDLISLVHASMVCLEIMLRNDIASMHMTGMCSARLTIDVIRSFGDVIRILLCHSVVRISLW